MIGTRTPFRVSFAGGGSDLRSFYRHQPGSVLSTSINKYMYLVVHPFFDGRIQAKYSRTELVDSIDDVQHPIIRTALRQFNLTGIDINSIADIPSGTGLGSSCSFTVGLLNALYAYKGHTASKERLAADACGIEIDTLGDPIGKQDIYAASYGGLNLITFHPDETVQVEPVVMPPESRAALERNLMLFYLGGTHPAESILAQQQANIHNDCGTAGQVQRMAELARSLRESLVNGRIEDMGPVLDENWRLKKQLADRISDPRIDAYYGLALQNGATGGKVLGAGGGGFLLLYCDREHQDKLRASLHDLRNMKFAFDRFGTQIVHYNGEEGVQ